MKKISMQMHPQLGFEPDKANDWIVFSLVGRITKDEYSKLLALSQDDFKVEVSIDGLE